MCNYCWGNRSHNANLSMCILKGWDGKKVLTLDTYLDDTELTTAITDDDKSLIMSGSFNIKYCPICGIRLHQHRIRKFFKKILDRD